MFIQVRLLKGYQEPLLYQIPLDWNSETIVGNIIKVPLRNKKVLAIVEKIVEQRDTTFEIKFPFSIEPFPKDLRYSEFINKLAHYYQIDAIKLISRLQQFILKKDKKETQNIDEASTINQNIILTDEQQKAYDYLKSKIKNNDYSPMLLHGVTGAGKTEIYKKLIKDAIAQQKSVIFLLPEVSLSLKFEQLFKNSFNEFEIFAFHSAVPQSQKKALWKTLIENKPTLIIGVHLPIFLPIQNLGLIIVDEEHDVGYQEKKHPKINSKEAAILRANLYNIPILLGSATPSITSLHNVKHKSWYFVQLKNRYAGAFPQIEVVQLNNKKQRKSFWISEKLENAIKTRLIKKEQILIFLNRRGYSFFVQCKTCSFIFKCKSCSVSLTLHKNNWLYCHYCGLSMQYPNHCFDCKSDKENFLKKGIGTEQVVTILENLFPNASIARADLDTTSKKKQWEKTLTDFTNNKIDILVGTQTITKGYHFPNVTLVGILWADLNLHFPIYNASETTLQQLIQVAGRAGRQSASSDVIVQTMLDHKIFDYINEINYLKFFNDEINQRKNALYPPFIRITEIEIKHTNELIANDDANKIANQLIQNNLNEDLQILGPVSPIVSKIKNNHMKKIYIKSKNMNDIIELFLTINKKKFKSKIFFAPNPIT